MRLNGLNGLKVLSVLAVMGLFASSAAAVTSGQVSATITDPEEGEEVKAGDQLTGDVPYTYELSVDSGTNDTTVDTLVAFTDENGTTYTKWVNGTAVSSGETVEVDGELVPSGYDYPENFSDVSLQVDATFTDDSDSSTASATDSVNFKIAKSTQFNDLIMVGVVLGVLGAFAGMLNKD